MGSPDMGDFPETAEQHELVVDNRIQEGDQEEEEKEEKEEKRIGAEEKEEEEEEEGEKREADKGEDTEQEEGLLDNYGLVPFSEDPPNIEVIPFEDFQKVLASLNGAAAIASQVRAQRDALLGNFECLLKMRKQSLSRINDLEVLKQRLKSKDLRLENAKVSLQEKSEDVAITKDRLLPSVRSLLAAAKALAIRCNHLQEKHRSLEGEGGYGKLLHIQSMLAARQRHMISQIAALYPIAPCPATEKVPTPTTMPLQSRLLINAVSSNSDSLARESQSVDRRDILPMKIGGLRVVAPLNNRSGLYTEPNDHESSATALGYVAHVSAVVCLS
ncbi:hypothetical protein KP509_06G018400 [Ceratopteris richardii]|uniref:Uncharacterized protein n=1 Tax=Ceratopteris richardii TaxID=49495 RepID=A0A8T2UDW6_CERRI|nr:hypothetical protein KP509_06G018400 [Ceratopteris richardii]KAH7434453.1 hypothetical protein KP509_06G018400 [Ceratopteris richardii]